MKRLLFLVLPLALSATAQAESARSIYTKIDLNKTCRQTAKADEQVFEGSWTCKGVGSYDVLVSAADLRQNVAFGKSFDKNCAGMKTFGGFNSAGGTVEWRLKNGKPFASILRWTVSIDPENSEKTATWLVVNKLENGTSCHVHYVAGSFPNANAVARNAADEKTTGFNCKNDKPTFDSNVGPPNISLENCSTLQQ